MGRGCDYHYIISSYNYVVGQGYMALIATWVFIRYLFSCHAQY